MSGPPDGKYLIVFSPDPPFPSPPIGVERSSEPILPIITGGSDNVFTVKKRDDGTYNIWLSNPDPLFRVTGVEGDDVVALTILSSTDPIEFTPWNISGSDGTYVISKPTKLVGATQCWFVETPGPERLPVILKSYPVIPGVVLPEWKFIPSIIPQ